MYLQGEGTGFLSVDIFFDDGLQVGIINGVGNGSHLRYRLIAQKGFVNANEMGVFRGVEYAVDDGYVFPRCVDFEFVAAGYQ